MNIFSNLIVTSQDHHQAIVDAVHAKRGTDPVAEHETLNQLMAFHQSLSLPVETLRDYIADLVATSAASEGFDSLASDPNARLGTHQLAANSRL